MYLPDAGASAAACSGLRSRRLAVALGAVLLLLRGVRVGSAGVAAIAAVAGRRGTIAAVRRRSTVWRPICRLQAWHHAL